MVPRVERRFLSTFIVDRHTYISYVTIYFLSPKFYQPIPQSPPYFAHMM